MARLLVLFVTAFVDMVGFAMILPLLPFYATHFGANGFVVGLLISAFSVAQLAVAPLWGRFSDRYGRRPAILAGLLITGGAYALFAFAGSLAALLFSRIIQGVGGGTIGVVQAYVADASPPEQRVKSLGWLSAVTSLGAVAGPAIGSLMVGLGGQKPPGLMAAALSLLIAAFAWRYLREARELEPERGPGAPGQAHTTSRAAIGMVLSRWDRPASRLIWIYAIAIGAFYGTTQTMPLLLSERMGITERNIGYFVMYLGGMGVLIRSLILGRAVDRLGEARLSRLGIVLLAAGLAVTGVAHGGAPMLAGFTLMPLGTAFLFPCVTGMLSRVVPAAERGLYMGVQHTFGGVSRVGFPIAAGLLMDRFGVGVPFWVSGLLVLLTLPLTLAMAGYLTAAPEAAAAVRIVAAADVTAEFPIEPVTGEGRASAG
ncbi:MAG TPA: MFS transporter [Gemmatimonadales bacterium]|jgi:MFS family permease|nr:MFS transporter [Gemmatimonadales bacterium]